LRPQHKDRSLLINYVVLIPNFGVVYRLFHNLDEFEVVKAHLCLYAEISETVETAVRSGLPAAA
jgi:hypothetical protein